MDDSTPDRPKRRIPRIRFSLRALMVVVLILGVGLGYWVVRSREQRDAVAAIECGGQGRLRLRVAVWIQDVG